MKRENAESGWTIEVADSGSQDWLGLLERSSYLVFHEPVWAEAMALAGYRNLCAVLLLDGEVRGGFLGFQMGFSICRVGYFNVPYGGFIGERPEGEILTTLLKRFGRQLGLARLQFVDFPRSGQIPNASFEVREDSTEQFRLKGCKEETLDRSYRKQLRQDLRKLKSAGVEVQSRNDVAALKVLHGHYRRTMKVRGGIVRYQLSWLEAVQKSLGPRCHVLVATRGDEDLGAMMIVDSGQCSHGLMLASDPEGPVPSVNKALLDVALRESLSRGKDFFDYMPSGTSASGVSHFKKLFGGEKVALHHEALVVNSFGNFVWKGLYAAAGTLPGRFLLGVKGKWKAQ